ncbi:hypothetical protein JHK85_011473 [Glycine max]|nr:hypothetical protein JHK85_011473 [Glycine max]
MFRQRLRHSRASNPIPVPHRGRAREFMRPPRVQQSVQSPFNDRVTSLELSGFKSNDTFELDCSRVPSKVAGGDRIWNCTTAMGE